MFLRRRSVPERKEAWEFSEGSYEGRPIITRFDRGAEALAGSREYPIQIGVAVRFRAPREDGFPSQDEAAELYEIEDKILELAPGGAVLVGVITTNGMREFVLYTGSGDWIAAFHAALRDAIPHHEVQVMAKHDPKWDVYRQFVR